MSTEPGAKDAPASGISYALEIDKATKRFGATLALDEVSLNLEMGEVLAVIGENGAGKSTLVKIVSGVVKPDSGHVAVHGVRVSARRPKEAIEAGVCTAYQELTLMPDLTVAENLFLPVLPKGQAGLVSRGLLYEKASHELRGVGIESIDVRSLVSDLRLGDKQKLEIAKAIIRSPKVLFLDEPTSALEGHDVHWLFDLIGRLKNSGTSIVYISHKMAELKQICDRMTILRNGRDVGTYGINELDDKDVIKLMIGRSQEAFFPARREIPAASETVLKVENLSSSRYQLSDVSLNLSRGEILGVAGLAGHGQREFFMALFGLLRTDGGQIYVRGKKVRINSPRAAVSPKIGIGLVPEDRKTEGLFLNMSTKENISLPLLSQFGRLGWLNTRAEKRRVLQEMAQMNIRENAIDLTVTSLSGGNQQKVVIGKWMMTGAKIMLLYDPTRGVDVGTKSEIYSLIRAFTDSGGAVLLYSSELPELVNLSDRIVVFRGGTIVCDLIGEQISSEACMAAAVGYAGAQEPTPAGAAGEMA